MLNHNYCSSATTQFRSSTTKMRTSPRPWASRCNQGVARQEKDHKQQELLCIVSFAKLQRIWASTHLRGSLPVVKVACSMWRSMCRSQPPHCSPARSLHGDGEGGEDAPWRQPRSTRTLPWLPPCSRSGCQLIRARR
jgi:hypothetical protein